MLDLIQYHRVCEGTAENLSHLIRGRESLSTYDLIIKCKHKRDEVIINN